MPFSLSDLRMSGTYKGVNFVHLTYVATLPCESWNTENAYEHKFSF